MEWEAVIGIEVHVQLNTKSKLFSGASTAYGADPNTQACEIDLGLPGVLPVLNKEALKKAVKFGLAIDAEINHESVFARKNYFYPDLPKGYQISQFDLPIVGKGRLTVQIDEDTEKTFGITRAHLEEDAGKSLHDDFHGMTGIDLNRAGTPLIEIVSEPDIRSAKEAVAYLKTLHGLVTHLDICDGNMQEGSFRCDANVSVRPKGQKALGTRTETKNVNSFRFVERAINYEIARQIEVIESGGKIVQETRLYDADKNETRSMRSKEDADEYRYFPCPDLMPTKIDDAFIANVRETLPELPHEIKARLIAEYGLSHYDASVLSSSKVLSQYFDQTIQLLDKSQAKLVTNWMMGELSGALNKANLEFEDSPIKPNDLANLLKRIIDNTISGKIAKTVFECLWNQEGSVDDIIEKQGLKQVTDTSAITHIIDEVMANNPSQLADYRAGKDKLFAFFVGQVMKASKGKANPQQVNDLLKEKLSS